MRKHENETAGVGIIEKPHTKDNETVCWHYSHAKGINILSALIHYGDFSLPIAFESVCKNLYFYGLEEKRGKRKSSVTKNALLGCLVKL